MTHMHRGLQALSLGAAALCVALSGDVHATETQAGRLLSGCKRVIVDSTKLPTALIAEGSCFGIVVGIGFADEAVCPPRGTTNKNMISTVIAFVEKNPARQQEDLMTLAQESLQEVARSGPVFGAASTLTALPARAC